MTAVVERHHVPGLEHDQARRGSVHLHVVEPVTVGRLSRASGECLCPKRRGSDERPLQPGDRSFLWRCDRCYAIARRHGFDLQAAA